MPAERSSRNSWTCCGRVARNTLAHANEQRDWRIFADVAQVLIQQARDLYAHEEMAGQLDETVFALDSTTIDLCLALFPWAPFERSKAAIKMHTLLDARGSIPTFVLITPARVSDVSVLDQLPLEAGAFYVIDRGYIHFCAALPIRTGGRLLCGARPCEHAISPSLLPPVDKSTGLRCDQTIVLTGQDSSRVYPVAARQVRYFDAEHNLRLSILTNNFPLPALTIAQLYKSRWNVELFFKWIKQHLRVKNFYGTSSNAVKTQLWVALIVYLLVAILRKRLGVATSLYKTLQILSVTLFEKTPILQVLESAANTDFSELPCNQLSLFTL